MTEENEFTASDPSIEPSAALDPEEAASTAVDVSPQERDSAVAPAVSVATKEEPGSFMRWLLETVVMVALAFALAQGIKAYIVQPFVIPTGSMEPTIMINDRILAEKLSFRWSEPKPGDIVVFDDPMGRYPQLIKRVIAVGGQTVDIRDGKVYVDGQVLSEPYLNGVQTMPGTEPMPQTIPEGYVWLMGDNRPNSGDSRFVGAQPLTAIDGRAFAIYWPLDRIGPLH